MVTTALGYTPPTSDTWRPLGTTSDTACAGNDSRLSNARPASDVYSWAKASSKPSYSWSEITSKPTSMPASDVYSWAKKSEAQFTEWVKGLITVDDISLADYFKKTEVNDLLKTNSEADQKYTDDAIKAAVEALDVTDTAVTGKYVSAVSEVDGKIEVSREDLPVYTLTSGTANGTVAFNGADVAVTGLGSAAFVETTAFDAAGSAAAAQAAAAADATAKANAAQAAAEKYAADLWVWASFE
jgi:hypothetical protein